MSKHYTITVRPLGIIAKPTVLQAPSWLKMMSMVAAVITAIDQSYGRFAKMHNHAFEEDGYVWTFPIDGEEVEVLELVVDVTPTRGGTNGVASPT